MTESEPRGSDPEWAARPTRSAARDRLAAAPPSQRRTEPDGRACVETTEEDLLVETACGDQDAFVELYDRTAGVVYGTILRVLRDPAQSEEVSQEVLVEVWRTANRFDVERGSARPWILMMAHRRAVDRVRSEQRSRDRVVQFASGDARRAFDEVAEQAEAMAEHAQLRELLSVLTDLQREAVELAYFRGYTYREVADLLHTPLGTIKSRIRDGVMRLRDALGVTA